MQLQLPLNLEAFRCHIARIMNGHDTPTEPEATPSWLLYENNPNRSPAWALRGPDRGLTPSERLMVKDRIYRLFNQCAQAVADLPEDA